MRRITVWRWDLSRNRVVFSQAAYGLERAPKPVNCLGQQEVREGRRASAMKTEVRELVLLAFIKQVVL